MGGISMWTLATAASIPDRGRWRTRKTQRIDSNLFYSGDDEGCWWWWVILWVREVLNESGGGESFVGVPNVCVIAFNQYKHKIHDMFNDERLQKSLPFSKKADFYKFNKKLLSIKNSFRTNGIRTYKTFLLVWYFLQFSRRTKSVACSVVPWIKLRISNMK